MSSSTGSNSTIETSTLEFTENEEEGDTYNQYRVVKHIGRGSYSQVYLVCDTETDTNYALKVCSKKQLKRKRVGRFGNALQDVEREVELLKTLSHKNVVRVREIINEEGKDKMCLVFVLAEKGAIMEGNGDEPAIDPDLARRVFSAMVYALEYVHSKLIIHRDVKPENILLDADDTPILSDFGVSHQLTEPDQKIRKTAGSPAYLSPQVCSGESYKGPPVDVWALGVTLYVMLTGNVPFMSDHIMDLYRMIKEDE